MKFLTAGQSALTLAGTAIAFVGVVGCQGQSATKWHANPIQDYPSVKAQANQAYHVGTATAPVVDPDNTQNVCYSAFNVDIDNDKGEKLLKFNELEAQTYTVHIRSYLGSDFSIQIPDAPSNFSFTEAAATAGNVKTFQLTWKPAKGDTDHTITLVYTSKFSAKCGSDIHSRINLEVKRSLGVPSLAIRGLPTSQVTFNNVSIQHFQILVDDPASTPQMPPFLNPAKLATWAQNGEHPSLDISKQIDCNQTPHLISGTQWQFDCSINIGAVGGDLNSGKIMDAIFDITAVSQRSHVESNPGQGQLKIEFPKSQVSAAPAPAAPAAKSAEVKLAKPEEVIVDKKTEIIPSEKQPVKLVPVVEQKPVTPPAKIVAAKTPALKPAPAAPATPAAAPAPKTPPVAATTTSAKNTPAAAPPKVATTAKTPAPSAKTTPAATTAAAKPPSDKKVAAVKPAKPTAAELKALKAEHPGLTTKQLNALAIKEAKAKADAAAKALPAAPATSSTAVTTPATAPAKTDDTSAVKKTEPTPTAKAGDQGENT